MIEEVKKIIVQRYSEEYQKVSDEHIGIRIKRGELEEKIRNLETEIMHPVVKKGFSLFRKILYKNKIKKADELRVMLNAEKSKLESEIEGLEEKEKSAREKLEKAQKAVVIKDLEIDMAEAFKLLKENHIPIVLTEADKVQTLVERDYSSKSAIIGVHKTRFAPTDSEIKTAKDAKATFKEKITINGREYEYEYLSERDTVHMAMNSEVASHEYGDWKDCKYSILIPMDEIPNEEIGCARPEDTFVKGSLSLSQNCWILCPIDEVGQIQNNNPNVHVIGYEGKSVLKYSNAFLSALGYRAEEAKEWSWADEESKKQFRELVKQEGLQEDNHLNTYFYEDEQILTYINIIVSICNVIKNNGLLKNAENIPNMKEQLLEDNIFAKVIDGLCDSSRFDWIEYPDAVVSNRRHLVTFFSKMEESGFFISDTYKTMINNIGGIGTGNINENNREDIFNGIEEVSEEEKPFIDELQRSTVPMRKIIENFIASVIVDSVARSKERIMTHEVDTEQDDALEGRTMLPNEIGKATIGVSHSSKEKAQMVVSQDIRAHELEENQREGVSIDGE